MDINNLESQQAQWANECCKHGDCPICNPPEVDEYDEEECPNCCSLMIWYNSCGEIQCDNCGYEE